MIALPDRPSAPKLADRVALVFGGGASGPGWGNGKSACVAYARAGAKIVVVDRVRAAAEDTAHMIAIEGGKAIALSADVTKTAAISAAVEAAVAQYGRIDILHNNVGITDMGALEDITEARWNKVMDVNLTAVVRTCRRVIPLMQHQGKGVIVNISSLAGAAINRYPCYSYFASKAGLNHLTKALAVQYAPYNIRANAIMPGMMDTPMVQQQIVGQYTDAEAMGRARAAQVPMGRQGTGWDVAHAAVFLASDDAAYITGVCLPVDGGLSCLAG